MKSSNHNYYLLIISLLLIIASLTNCEKQNLQLLPYNPKKFLPLQIGSYWVFQTDYNSSDGTEISFGTDSLFIQSDTMIQGQPFFLLEGTWLGQTTYREYLTYSGNQIISNKGKIYFQGSKIGTVINSYAGVSGSDTNYYEEYRMVKPIDEIVVPAGSFQTLALQCECSNPSSSDQINVSAQWYFSKNVGLVKLLAAYHLDGYSIDMKLLRYSISPTGAQ